MRPVTSRCGELAASLENFINAMRECRGQDPLYPTRQESDEVRFYREAYSTRPASTVGHVQSVRGWR